MKITIQMFLKTFIIETLCPVLTDVQERYGFDWIIGGSAPLSLFQTACFGPGDIDLWIWREGKPYDEKEMEVLSKDLATRLYGDRGEISNTSSTYTTVNIHKTSTGKKPDEILPPFLQLIDVTDSIKDIEGIQSRGAKALGASVLDIFDISVCRVGIMVPREKHLKAYNENHLGKMGLTSWDMGGTKRTHYIDYTRPDCDACNIFHDGTCEALCLNDVVAHPLHTWDGQSTDICCIQAEVPHIVFRPSIAKDILGGLHLQSYFTRFSTARGGIGDFRPSDDLLTKRLPIMRINPVIGSMTRLFYYAKRGFYPVLEGDTDPRLLEATRKRFSAREGFVSPSLNRDEFLMGLPGLTVQALKAQRIFEHSRTERYEECAWLLAKDILKLSQGAELKDLEG